MGVRFELTVPFRAHRISSAAHSATLAPHREAISFKIIPKISTIFNKNQSRQIGTDRANYECGPCRIRTGDLLHAMEARYQLRQWPSISLSSGSSPTNFKNLYMGKYIKFIKKKMTCQKCHCGT